MRVFGRLTVITVSAIVTAGGVGLLWTSTNPTVIHARVSVLGPRPVYRALTCCYGDPHPKWDDVVEGVRSGVPAWLRVAVDLRPALDTHPGEEMATAVTAALEANPQGAVETLVPAYGADLVCGGNGSEEFIDSNRAAARLKQLEALPATSPAIDRCRATLRSIVAAGVQDPAAASMSAR